MAYTATITSVTRVISGRRHIRLVISETEAAAASEWSWGDSSGEDLPAIGTITLYQSTLTAGTATTIAPRLGKATGWSDDSQDAVTGPPTAAAYHQDQTIVRFSHDGTARPALYGQSVPDAGADNTISTIIDIVEGHLPS